MRPEEETLDPIDPAQFRQLAHAALDDCLDFILSVRERPVWQPVPDSVASLFHQAVPHQPTALPQLLAECRDSIMPFATGNIHPRFFGWAHGSGTTLGIIAEMMAATMNSNCGGRDHVAIHVERQIVEWCHQIFGFPDSSSGVLTVGTSMASVIAIAIARFRKLGPRVLTQGASRDDRLIGYCSTETHVAIRKAFQLLGLGSAQLRAIPTGADFSMSIDRLAEAIQNDRSAGLTPFVVIGTAGSVNTGAFDDLAAIAGIAAQAQLWFHVDGAFGAWASIAAAPWNRLVQGIEQADSLAFDFHKWISAPYDVGCVLVRDRAVHRAAFAERPEYLTTGTRGLGGGAMWPCDYGIDLSRGFRALKVWMTLRHHGIEQLGRMITKNCLSARYLAGAIEESPEFALAAPVALNICCFHLKADVGTEVHDRLMTNLVEELQLSGIAAPSTARIGGKLCVRVAILNHRTTNADLHMLVQAASEMLSKLAR